MVEFYQKNPQKSGSLWLRRIKGIFFDAKRRPGIGKSVIGLFLVIFSLLYFSISTLSDENDESFEVNNYGSNENLLVKKSRYLSKDIFNQYLRTLVTFTAALNLRL
jgi:hypothetical protein